MTMSLRTISELRFLWSLWLPCNNSENLLFIILRSIWWIPHQFISVRSIPLSEPNKLGCILKQRSLSWLLNVISGIWSPYSSNWSISTKLLKTKFVNCINLLSCVKCRHYVNATIFTRVLEKFFFLLITV